MRGIIFWIFCFHNVSFNRPLILAMVSIVNTILWNLYSDKELKNPTILKDSYEIPLNVQFLNDMIYHRSFISASSMISSTPNCQHFLNTMCTPEICVPNPGSTICCSSFKPDFCFSQGMKYWFKEMNGNFAVYFRKGRDFPPHFSSSLFKMLPMRYVLWAVQCTSANYLQFSTDWPLSESYSYFRLVLTLKIYIFVVFVLLIQHSWIAVFPSSCQQFNDYIL